MFWKKEVNGNNNNKKTSFYHLCLKEKQRSQWPASCKHQWRTCSVKGVISTLRTSGTSGENHFHLWNRNQNTKPWLITRKRIICNLFYYMAKSPHIFIACIQVPRLKEPRVPWWESHDESELSYCFTLLNFQSNKNFVSAITMMQLY